MFWSSQRARAQPRNFIEVSSLILAPKAPASSLCLISFIAYACNIVNFERRWLVFYRGLDELIQRLSRNLRGWSNISEGCGIFRRAAKSFRGFEEYLGGFYKTERGLKSFEEAWKGTKKALRGWEGTEKSRKGCKRG